MGQYDPKKPKKINAFSVTLALILSVGGYLGAWWLPHWWNVWNVSSVMRGVAYAAYNNIDDEQNMARLLKEATGRTKLRLTRENFEIVRDPYPPEELTAAMEGSTNWDYRKTLEKRGYKVHINFTYSVDAKWPLQDKSRKISFYRTEALDMRRVNW